MAIARMQKVALLAHRSVAESLLVRLQEEGVLEVTDAGEARATDHIEARFQASELDFAIATLLPLAPKDVQVSLRRTPLAGEVIAAASTTDIQGMTARLHELHETDGRSERERMELQNRLAILAPWAGLHEPLESVQSGTSSCARWFGTVPSVHVEALFAALQTSLPRTAVTVLLRTPELCTLDLLVWRDDAARAEEMLTTHGWTTLTLPEGKGRVADLMAEAHAQLRSLEADTAARRDERQRLAASLPALVKVRTYLRWLEERQAVREKAQESESITMLTGWMQASRIPALETALSGVSRAIALLPIAPDEGEEPPILLQNRTMITPFESVTTLYGLPLASEFDPTTSLSAFFALFFGLCLTDAGYGLVLALLFGGYVLGGRKSIHDARLPWLLFLSGIVTVIVSIPFGGWFGLMPEQAPAFLTHDTPDGLRFIGQLWNLSDEKGIAFLQNLSLALGLTHIFFGVLLAGWHKWIHGARAEAFWTSFTTHILLGAVLLHVVRPFEGSIWMVWGAAALFLWGKGYGSPWYLRPIMGFLGAANFAIGLLSNGLSYLRLLALGLVTGAIALAVNQVAIELGKLFPLWLGIPVTFLIAIMGHTVSIALNTLGSFIHSGRLQFIEFFSQFFEGGGRPFSPFSRSIS